MRASRLLSLLIRLQLRGRATAEALAEEFEVSVRTIYRDVEALSAAGVPIYADRGPGGGFALLEGYRTRLTGLNLGEAAALLLAGLPGPAADLGLGEAVAGTRLKLLAALPAGAANLAARVGDRFHLDPVDWYRRASAPPRLAPVARAVFAGTRLAILYQREGGAIARTVDPLGLVMKAGSWYLIARIDAAIRTYKVARIVEAQALAETFDHPPGFDLAAHWRESLARYEASLRRGEAVLRVAPAAMAHIGWLGADMSEPIAAAEPGPDGARTCRVVIESIEEAAFLLAGFGGDIDVIEPPELRRALAALGRTLASRYAERPELTASAPPPAP